MDLGAQEGDLAAHVRYWGNWVLERAREELAPYYPMVDGKPTVAYLWARTVPCQDPKCGAVVPLLKTLWLCKKDNKRRALRLKPNAETRRVEFQIWEPGPKDEVPPGTMSGAKSRCPVCGSLLTPEYIKRCGHESKMGAQMTAVVMDTLDGKEYYLPTSEEEEATRRATHALPEAGAQIPYGLPTEPLPGPETLGFRIPLYGFQTWADLFTPRQLLALAVFVKWIRQARKEMLEAGYHIDWVEAISAYLSIMADKLADRNSQQCIWISTNAEKAAGTFGRFAFQITWDFVEIYPWSESAGGVPGSLEHMSEFLDHVSMLTNGETDVNVICQDASEMSGRLKESIDAIVTDPPYYDAIPYSNLSDFFYVWLRRSIGDLFPDQFGSDLAPKSNEIVQHTGRFGGDADAAKKFYENGMAGVFHSAQGVLASDGRMVVVFAHKQPDAWETLVAAMIDAGFVVTASWPIDTERTGRVRAQASAALASSVWLVCRKRPADVGIGRYGKVKEEMQGRITERLRYFWDQGVSGPDFMWAAVGPALESYSTYGEVRRMDGSPFTVGEFLREVRRLVADFALSRILHGSSTEGLDEWTRYYLIHRSSFSLAAAPVGECILLAQGYGLDLNEIKGSRGILVKGKAKKAVDEDEDADSPFPSETGEEARGGGGSDIRLLSFDERKRDDLGEPHPSGGLPLIDMLHRLMRLWQAGDTEKLTAYVQQHGLSQNDLFWAVAQAILEMADPKTKERALLEALVAWGRGKPAQAADQPALI
jgi:adenine-specific DNA methylase